MIVLFGEGPDMFLCSITGDRSVEMIREWAVGQESSPESYAGPWLGVVGVLPVRMRIRLGEGGQIYEASAQVHLLDWDVFARQCGEMAAGRCRSTVLFSRCRRYGLWVSAAEEAELFNVDARFEGISSAFPITTGVLKSAAEELQQWKLAAAVAYLKMRIAEKLL
jgi:hypothetical protein